MKDLSKKELVSVQGGNWLEDFVEECVEVWETIERVIDSVH